MQHYSKTQIADSLRWPRLIEALRQGFRKGCTMPVRHHHDVELPDGSHGILLLMPAWTSGRYLGLKMATLFSGNPSAGLETIQATYILCSATTGQPLASFDGAEITARRTAAASALAGSYLIRANARRHLVVGTGRLAPLIAQAHSSVHPIREVEVWGREVAKAEAVCAELSNAGFEARAVLDLERAVSEADVISCVTSSETPLVLGSWLQPGCHLDLVGSFRREMREADDEAVAKSRVFVDCKEPALEESGELLHALDSGVFEATDVLADLFQLCPGEHPGRENDEEITLFKSVGVALEDLAAAVAVHEDTD